MFRVSLAVLAWFLVLSATAQAQAIDACVAKSGILKVLDEDTECLPQEKPITLGQPQPAAETVRVFDGNGRDIGVFVGSSGNGELLVILRGTGVIMRLNAGSGYPLGAGFSIYYELRDCQGEGVVQARYSNRVISARGSWVVGATTGFKETFEYRSALRSGLFCDNGPFPPNPASSVVPIEAYTGDLGVTFPLPLPLWIGSSTVSP